VSFSLPLPADSSLLGKDSPPTPTMYKYRPGYSSSSSSAALPHSTSAKVKLCTWLADRQHSYGAAFVLFAVAFWVAGLGWAFCGAPAFPGVTAVFPSHS